MVRTPWVWRAATRATLRGTLRRLFGFLGFGLPCGILRHRGFDVASGLCKQAVHHLPFLRAEAARALPVALLVLVTALRAVAVEGVVSTVARKPPLSVAMAIFGIVCNGLQPADTPPRVSSVIT